MYGYDYWPLDGSHGIKIWHSAYWMFFHCQLHKYWLQRYWHLEGTKTVVELVPIKQQIWKNKSKNTTTFRKKIVRRKSDSKWHPRQVFQLVRRLSSFSWPSTRSWPQQGHPTCRCRNRPKNHITEKEDPKRQNLVEKLSRNKMKSDSRKMSLQSEKKSSH